MASVRDPRFVNGGGRRDYPPRSREDRAAAGRAALARSAARRRAIAASRPRRARRRRCGAPPRRRARPAISRRGARAATRGDQPPGDDRADQRDQRAELEAHVERVDERLLDGLTPACAGGRAPPPSDDVRRACRSARRRRGQRGRELRAIRSTLISAPVTATPNVPPTIRNIESTPEATPALVDGTAFIAAVLIGDITRPMPTPISTNAAAQVAVGGVDGR